MTRVFAFLVAALFVLAGAGYAQAQGFGFDQDSNQGFGQGFGHGFGSPDIMRGGPRLLRHRIEPDSPYARPSRYRLCTRHHPREHPPSGGFTWCCPMGKRCATASGSAATASAGAASTASRPRRNGRAGPRRRKCCGDGPTCRGTWPAASITRLAPRAIYLGSTLYRIHGSNEPETIGQAVSSGCFRMTNEDVVDLYGRVQVGATVVVKN